MNSVLISIRPEWVEKIASGQKTIEVRKTAPKGTPFKAYIYATKPKKFYKCGAVSTSDELLWFANGKVEMGDGFKFWADGDEYQCLNGKVIGEFICDRIYPIKAERYDGGSFERSRKSLLTFLSSKDHSALLFATRLTTEEIFDYLGGEGKWGYGWHISDLKIYDKPKELSEFHKCNFNSMNGTEVCGNYHCKYYLDSGSYMIPPSCAKNGCRVTRPPQSWMFAKEINE